MQVLQNFFGRSKDNEDLRYKISDFDLQLDDLKDFMDNLRCSNEESQPSQR